MNDTRVRAEDGWWWVYAETGEVVRMEMRGALFNSRGDVLWHIARPGEQELKGEWRKDDDNDTGT